MRMYFDEMSGSGFFFFAVFSHQSVIVRGKKWPMPNFRGGPELVCVDVDLLAACHAPKVDATPFQVHVESGHQATKMLRIPTR